jgi:hypothetical protein
MRKILMAALALALVIPASNAVASSFSVFGSYWNSSDLDDALGAGVKFSFPVAGRLNVDLRGTFYQPFDEEALRDEIRDLGDDEDRDVFGELEVLPIDAGISIPFATGGSMRPSVGAGATYYLMDTEGGAVEDEYGWYANLALEFAGDDGFGFFTEALYRAASGTVDDTGDEIDFVDRVEFDLDGFAVNAGMVWRF